MMQASLHRFFVAVIVVTLMCCAAPHRLHAAIIYDINYNGARIDLTGFIKTAGLGTFTGATFDFQALDYSITASQNGAFLHTFTPSNSTWGLEGNGFNVQITVSPSQIQLISLAGTTSSFGNLFLLADTTTNGAQENLRLGQNQFGFRGSSFLVFDTVPVPFTLATAAVPEPASLTFWSLGALGIILLHRRRRTTASFPVISETLAAENTP